MCIQLSVYAQHCADNPGISTTTGVLTDPGKTDNLSSNTVIVAGVAVSVVVLVFAVVSSVVLVVWLR